ncbi:MAG TPA: hypothetical protein VFG10_19515 [Saprospiraceae bacterium]|nr:hypothetical protein [Saprospiraceae bacterium]
MPPFTTYIIPETSNKETANTDNWLWIVVDQPLLPAHEELLQKICEALKADYTSNTRLIISNREENLSLSDLNSSHASLVLSFGIQPSILGIWIDLHHPGIRYLESYCFILTIGLSELINQPAAKKQLWSSMQSFIHAKLDDEMKKENGEG